MSSFAHVVWGKSLKFSQSSQPIYKRVRSGQVLSLLWLRHTFQDTMSKFYHYHLSTFFSSPSQFPGHTHTHTHTFECDLMGEMNNHINRLMSYCNLYVESQWELEIPPFTFDSPLCHHIQNKLGSQMRSYQYVVKQEGRSSDKEFSNISFLKELV